MSVLFIDGMDIYGATSDLESRYDAVNVDDIAFGAAIGRFGGGGIIISNSRKYIQKSIPGTPETVIISFALFRASTTSSFIAEDIIYIKNNVSNLLLLENQQNTSNLRVSTGNTLIGTVSIGLNAWHWISIKVKADSSGGGTIDIYVDRKNRFSYLGQTVVSGSETCNDFQFGADTDQDYTYDDLIICDNAGSAPFNDILDDRRIDTVFPDGAGSSTDWTPDSGSNYARVQTADGDTSYVEADTSAEKDLYTMDDMSFSPDVIDGVNVVALMKNPDSGATEVKLKIKENVTEDTGSDLSIGSDYAYQDEFFLENPDTLSAWVEAEVNAMQAGMEIV